VFAWEDKFRRLLLRFDRLSRLIYPFKTLAYTDDQSPALLRSLIPQSVRSCVPDVSRRDPARPNHDQIRVNTAQSFHVAAPQITSPPPLVFSGGAVASTDQNPQPVVNFSRLTNSPHTIAVYASWPPSPTGSRNTRCRAGATPYPGRTFTGWIRSVHPDAPPQVCMLPSQACPHRLTPNGVGVLAYTPLINAPRGHSSFTWAESRETSSGYSN
jgi:hypothetical protein